LDSPLHPCHSATKHPLFLVPLPWLDVLFRNGPPTLSFQYREPGKIKDMFRILLLMMLLLGHRSGGILAQECSWPRFRGPKGDGISTDTGLMTKWLEAAPKLLWTAEGLGHGFGSVTLDGGFVCVAGDIGRKSVVTALTMDGDLLWQFENGHSWESPTPGGRSTPTLDAGKVYHENAHGILVCLAATTGSKIWGRDLVKEFGGRSSTWGYAESPVIDDERLICCPGGDTAMAALNKQTGETVWKSPSSGEPAGYATPILADHPGLPMILTMSEKSLISVNAETGDLLWRFEHYTPRYVANCVSPIYHDGKVFISGGYGKGCVLLKVIASGKRAHVEPVWRTKNLDNRHGGVILLNGFLYGASQMTNKGKWVCLEWKTGRLMYAEPGIGEGSITYAERMFYTLSERREMGLVRAAPHEYKLVSHFTLPEGGQGNTWAHPVVCGGRLYVRHGERLYVYDVRAN